MMLKITITPIEFESAVKKMRDHGNEVVETVVLDLGLEQGLFI